MNRIKYLRMEKGVKQAELAKYLNVAPNTLSNWENDNFEPDFSRLKKIAEYFNTTTDYIIGKTDDPTLPNKKAPPNPEPDIKWGDFSISFYGGKKNLTQKQKDKIAKIVQSVIEEFADED